MANIAAPLTRSDTSYSNCPDVDLDDNGFEDIALAAPRKALTPTRQALGSRLLSTLSEARIPQAVAPTASALQRSKSVFHSRAKSLAAFVPALNTTASSENSRISQEKDERTPKANKLFGDLFSGQSAPIHLGIPASSPTREKEESELIMDYKPTFTGGTTRPSLHTRRQSTAPAPAKPSKFPWFSRPQPQEPSLPTTDELLTLNIPTALPTDPSTPTAFADLLATATSLLTRMQTAYKEKSDYIASMRPELEAQREEVEEAATRSAHLKIQLTDMAALSNAQQQQLQEMRRELAAERQERQRLEAVQHSSIRHVRPSLGIVPTHGNSTEPSPQRRRKRGSAGSGASDSGFESDAETDSVFSGRGAETPLSPPALAISPDLYGASWREKADFSRPGTAQGESAAWAAVARLRLENGELQERVRRMEGAVDGCLALVGF